MYGTCSVEAGTGHVLCLAQQLKTNQMCTPREQVHVVGTFFSQDQAVQFCQHARTSLNDHSRPYGPATFFAYAINILQEPSTTTLLLTMTGISCVLASPRRQQRGPSTRASTRLEVWRKSPCALGHGYPHQAIRVLFALQSVLVNKAPLCGVCLVEIGHQIDGEWAFRHLVRSQALVNEVRRLLLSPSRMIGQRFSLS